jgi:hypothetical protein
MNIRFSYIDRPDELFSGLHLYISEFALRVTAETDKKDVILELDDVINQLVDIKNQITEG